MGCCNSSNNSDPNELNTRIRECIESGTLKRLSYYLSLKVQEKKANFNIDFVTLRTSEGDEVNILGYSLICGRLDIFKLLSESYNASFVSMESYFEKCEFTGLQSLCENGFSDFLEYYTPIYFSLEKPKIKETTNRKLKETIEFGEQDENKPPISQQPDDKEEELTPIQYAVRNGHISVVKFALNYITTLRNIPVELDLHYIDKYSGQNCALVACKSGNYNLIKYLHTVCKANFKVLNNNKENAIQILAAEAKKKNLPEFYQCLVYLIEKIEIDIRYNYEETLILLEYVKAVDYFLLQLEKIGIRANKKKIESEILVKPPKRGTLNKYETNEKFIMAEVFPEFKDDDTSTIKGSVASSRLSTSSLFKQ